MSRILNILQSIERIQNRNDCLTGKNCQRVHGVEAATMRLKRKRAGNRKMLVRISILLILGGGGILILSACTNPAASEGRKLVTLRVCVVKGASLTQQGQSFSDVGNDKIDTLLSQAIKDLNTKW